MTRRNKTSVYESIVEEYETLIRVGALKKGEKLPSVRALAVERGINPNTVERAYVALENAGFIRVYPKKGAYVEFTVEGVSTIESGVKRTLAEWKQQGVTKAEIEKWTDETFGEDS